jgi:hypothetical protein
VLGGLPINPARGGNGSSGEFLDGDDEGQARATRPAAQHVEIVAIDGEVLRGLIAGADGYGGLFFWSIRPSRAWRAVSATA